MNQPPVPSVSLSDLRSVPLVSPFRELHESAAASCFGSEFFRRRKLAELHEFLALAQVSGRIQPLAINLQDAIQLDFLLRCPVPTLAPDGALRVHDRAHVYLHYPEAAVRTARPGTSFVQILQPQGLWLPNAAPVPGASSAHRPSGLCLGTLMPPGIRLREIVLMTFDALTLRTVQMDPRDHAGVLNREAALWWQSNTARLPLTREPFLTLQTAA
jgi:hypothetical protein